MEIDKSKRSFFPVSILLAACLIMAVASRAQSPTPSPSSSPEEDSTGISIISSAEIGYRFLDVNGDHEKYRSDLNYRAGVRLFDSSFLIRDNTSGDKMFDTLSVTASGWGSDPTGSFRLNMDRTGLYKFDSNIRRVRYYNNLKNHAVNWSQTFPNFSEHYLNTLNHFGDFDLTIFPERDLRFRVGYSFNNTDGPGFNPIRFQSDEYAVDSVVKTQSHEFRGGVEGKLLGFNLGFNYGHRNFRDRTHFFEDTLNPGNNPATTTSYVDLSSRQFRNKGTIDYGHFYFQRTFGKVFDVSGRFVYSESRSDVQETDLLIGRVSLTGNRISPDEVSVPAEIKRPQTRADIGATYRITHDFRISNTFTFDQFNIGGANTFFERVVTNFAAGGTSTSITNSYNFRTTRYRRFANLFEGDYQFGNRASINLGYRFTHRDVGLNGGGFNLVNNTPSTFEPEEQSNTTNSFIMGGKYKLTDDWAFFGDMEWGSADNVFTRLANNDFINYRLRAIGHVKQFGFNLSFISKDNDSPGRSTAIGAVAPFDTTFNSKTRIFASSVDWTPRPDLAFSGGYTYTHLTSRGDIIVPVGTPYLPSTQFLQGISEYFARDSYFYFDVSARPFRRVSIYAAYRVDDDGGQGDRMTTRPQDFIYSYPMTYHQPEIKISYRINNHIDWNVGYQYYSYSETPYFNPFSAVTYPTYAFRQIYQAQNYTAHMPYTSIRIYWGRRAEDR
jgi:hypothetical protein